MLTVAMLRVHPYISQISTSVCPNITAAGVPHACYTTVKHSCYSSSDGEEWVVPLSPAPGGCLCPTVRRLKLAPPGKCRLGWARNEFWALLVAVIC
jgi:hypothetical protein